MKFFAAIIHIWFLGVMPIISLSVLFFNPDIYKPLKVFIPESLLLMALISGIIGLFYIFAYSFFIGGFYLDLSDKNPSVSHFSSYDYYLMVASPLLWLILVYFFNPKDLKFEVTESGAIALISQHAMLHLVSFITYTKRSKSIKREIFRIVYLVFSLALFLIISLYTMTAYYLFENSIFWKILFYIFCVSASWGSFRFYYRNRFALWKEFG